MTPKRLAKELVVLAALLLCGMGAKAADKERPPVPVARISLQKLGFPGASTNFVAAGASVLTVNFLDDEHLLVSYGMRGLVTRLAGDPATDEDREVAAQIIEIPSGKIVARTQWHLHDHGRYLWPIGHGRFMLRMGGSLSMLAPVANLHTDPFRRVEFPSRGLVLNSISASPDGGVLSVESQVPQQAAGVATWADVQAPQNGIVLDLYRMSGEGTAESPLSITSPHSVKSPHSMAFPIDEDGFLWTENTTRDPSNWTVSFHAFAPAGKKNPVVVGDLHSSCVPRILIASRSEYVALTCVGVDAHMKLMTYGFDGHENWEEPIDLDSSIAFAFAPGTGRFAMSRITTSISSAVNANGMPVEPTFRQEVRVYQTETGDMVLKATTTPALKTAENFDLSQDGKLAALVQNGDIAIYQLPAPSEKDRKAMQEVAKYAPPPGGNAELSLEGVVVREQPGETVAGSAPRVATPVAGAAPAAAAANSATKPAAAGPNTTQAADNAAQATRPVTTASMDAPTTPARKAPTLLLPGEKAEFKDKRQPQVQQ